MFKIKIYKSFKFIKFIISFVLIIIISMLFVSFFSKNTKNIIPKNVYSKKYIISDLNSINNLNKKSNKIAYKLYDNIEAFLTIPSLNIYQAPISEGTTQNVMKNYIGHFSNTSYDVGNIGLASHNRGNGACYFKDLYKLKKGDYIFYTYKDTINKYVVSNIVVIDSYDWSYLENTSENKLTLITCINDKPQLRLCIQALQM